MSVKHVNEYYKKICNDYKNMVNTLVEMEEYVQQNIISPEKLDNIKESVEAMKSNYQRISWIMYLLNLPNKKEKRVKYERQNKCSFNELKDIASIDTIHMENQSYIDDIKNKIKE